MDVGGEGKASERRGGFLDGEFETSDQGAG